MILSVQFTNVIIWGHKTIGIPIHSHHRPDAKVLHSIAMLNELHIGDPGLNLMQELIKAKPKYDKGILLLRMLMKRKGLVLVKSSDDSRELVDDFNGDMPDEAFAEKLRSAREKAPKAVDYLLRLIKKQEF